ncbi:MAG: bifunctional DNA primase/polymerase [Pseudomonadota bacterium]
MANGKEVHAVKLAELGFHVFPIAPDQKAPPVKDWQKWATRDPAHIVRHWPHPNANIGISTSHGLLVVDVDPAKGGNESLLALELAGHELPPTRTQTTARKGRHLIYSVPQAVKQGADVLGKGLDIRSNGGYIVAAGSTTADGAYAMDETPIAPAPAWLIAKCGAPRAKTTVDYVIERATQYLKTDAPLAVEGTAGDQTTYQVAARVKDFGVLQPVAIALMLEHWNDRCTPPWAPDELDTKVANAYRYGNDAPGIADPSTDFKPVVGEVAPGAALHPFAKLNQEYAFILAGGTGSILWETTDQRGRYCFHLLNKEVFKDKLASHKIRFDDKLKPLTTAWLESEERRSYDGLIFEPGRDMGPRWYNMWRGYATTPADSATHPMVERWKEHLLHNICGGVEPLAQWLTGWLAHLIQRPYEKPLVAIVFKGSKGVGKNAMIERVGHLLGPHALVTSRRRYLVSNFTMHLQKCLLFVLDEAFWSGDKEAEGVVKDLITGSEHLIEPKGKESYTVRNLTRIVVIGNEDWLVPASYDERRWAVFNVGDGRKQDKLYFEEMRHGLDNQGGNAHLLRYLLDFDLASVDINAAPDTDELANQKHASLDPFPRWWHNCLREGRLLGGDFEANWPREVGSERFRQAFQRYARENGMGRYLPDDRSMGHSMKKFVPSVTRGRMSKQADGSQPYTYKLPELDKARAEWGRYIGHEVSWE